MAKFIKHPGNTLSGKIKNKKSSIRKKPEGSFKDPALPERIKNTARATVDRGYAIHQDEESLSRD
jgi:hypothetical protein